MSTDPNMDTFIQTMILIITAGIGITAFSFRKGGIYYNKDMKDFTDLDYLHETPKVPPPEETMLKQPVLSEKRPTLTQILTYMRDFEGKPGDANYRNNNPLNYRFYDPKGTGTDSEYLPKYRPVKCSKNYFAKFRDYDTGWLYAMNDKKNKIKNHPNWTLYDMINNHAPPEDNNPVDRYVANVAKRAGVDKLFPVKNIVLV